MEHMVPEAVEELEDIVRPLQIIAELFKPRIGQSLCSALRLVLSGKVVEQSIRRGNVVEEQSVCLKHWVRCLRLVLCQCSSETMKLIVVPIHDVEHGHNGLQALVKYPRMFKDRLVFRSQGANGTADSVGDFYANKCGKRNLVKEV